MFYQPRWQSVGGFLLAEGGLAGAAPAWAFGCFAGPTPWVLPGTDALSQNLAPGCVTGSQPEAAGKPACHRDPSLHRSGPAETEPPSNAVSFEMEEGNDLFWGSDCTRCSATVMGHPSLPAPLRGGIGESLPLPSGCRGLDPCSPGWTGLVPLPHHPQAIDAVPVVPGALEDPPTKASRMPGAAPTFHRPTKWGEKNIMLALAQGAASSGCAQDRCPWSAGLDAPLFVPSSY